MLVGETISLNGLVIETYLGVFAWERQRPMKLVLDVSMSVQYEKGDPGDSDDIREAVDYSKVAEDIRALAMHQAFELIEALSNEISTRLMAKYSAIVALSLKVHKVSAVPECQSVSIERTYRRA